MVYLLQSIGRDVAILQMSLLVLEDNELSRARLQS